MAYLIATLVILHGTTRWPDTTRETPTVTVIIAARDEEDALPECLDSIADVDYPNDLWEVTVVDDRSVDRTSEIVEEWRAHIPNLQLHRVNRCPEDMGGKQNALAEGIDRSDHKSDVILFTDADCRVPPTWIRDMVGRMTAGVGVVAGLTDLRADGPFGAAQAGDLTHLLTVTWGLSGLGVPMSLIGNNFAIRRVAYRQIGGYRALGRTVAEDFAILSAITAQTGWNVACAADLDRCVESDPEFTFGGFWRQRARWASGSTEVRGWKLGLLVFSLLQRSALIGSVIAAALGATPLLTTLAAVGCWYAADIALIVRGTLWMGRPERLWTAFVVPWFQLAYQTAIGLRTALHLGPIVWKGEVYKT